MNIKQATPDLSSESDSRLLRYIRRVNLDMFWSREPPTVSALLTQIRKGKKMSQYLGLAPMMLPVGPWPVKDDLGFQIAIENIHYEMYSLLIDTYIKDYVKKGKLVK